MFKLQAPFPRIQTTSLLPNPEFGDSENLAVEVNLKRAMDGTRYTYVKRKGRRRLQWTFHLSRNKGLEVRAFLQTYLASKVRLVDHNGRVWIGVFMNNPFEFETDARTAPAIAPMPRGERQVITLEFEGEEAL